MGTKTSSTEKVHAMHNHRNHMDLLLAAAAGFIVLADLGVPVLTHLPVLAVCPLRGSTVTGRPATTSSSTLRSHGGQDAAG